MRYQRNYIFGAPFRAKDRRAFEAALLKRHNGDADKACAYINKMADRQILKGSGILSCTSILAGMSYFVQARASLIIAMIAVVMTASMFYSKWALNADYFENAMTEFISTCAICYNRAIFNSISAFLIILSVVLLVSHLIPYNIIHI